MKDRKITLLAGVALCGWFPTVANAQAVRAVTYGGTNSWMTNAGHIGGPATVFSGHFSCWMRPTTNNTMTIWQATAQVAGVGYTMFEWRHVPAGAGYASSVLYFADAAPVTANAIEFIAPTSGKFPIDGKWHNESGVFSLNAMNLEIANGSIDGSLFGYSFQQIQGSTPQPPIAGDTWYDGAEVSNGVTSNYYVGDRAHCVLHMNVNEDDWNYYQGGPAANTLIIQPSGVKPLELGANCYGPYSSQTSGLGAPVICEQGSVAQWKNNLGALTSWSGGNGLTVATDDPFAALQ